MKPMKRVGRALLPAIVMLAGPAEAALEVQSIEPLLIRALHDGQASGVLVGPMANTMAELFKTTAPLTLAVKTVRLISPGCRRLEVTASQDGVMDRNAARQLDRPEHRRLVYQVSMCLDGTYPERGTPARRP